VSRGLLGGFALLVCWWGAAAAADLQHRATEAVEERRFEEARLLPELMAMP
jgi:hypothetical protein